MPHQPSKKKYYNTENSQTSEDEKQGRIELLQDQNRQLKGLINNFQKEIDYIRSKNTKYKQKMYQQNKLLS